METAEELMAEKWTTTDQWSIYRYGRKDGIVVLILNPPWGRSRTPMLDFLIYKNGVEVNSACSYDDMKKIVKELKEEVK